MKRKNVLIIAVLIMCIGFAAISTTLIINGSTTVSENADDFSVIFTAASLDGTDVYANVISQDKKTITFETKDLKSVNDNSVLTYEITNNSSNYDAEVSVNCKVKDEGSAKYTSIKNEFDGNATKVLAKETINGKLTINLEKIATEEVREEYVCALTFNALERDTLGETYSGPTEWTFNYTGSEQTFTVPISGTYKIETWGAQGGVNSSSKDNALFKFSYGGYTSGIINLMTGIKLYVYVGQTGNNLRTDIFNGGGIGGLSEMNSFGQSGGGATDVRIVKDKWNNFSSLKSRVMVAGGGGGSANGVYTNGGQGSYAGGLSGYNGGYYPNHVYNNEDGKGGTQVSGGSAGTNIFSATGTVNPGTFGIGGNDYSISSGTGAGGGGAGYYGGGAGGGTAGGGNGQGGGGGSSFISGHNGCDAISEESESNNIIHTGQSVHYSGYKFTDTVMIDGTGCLWTNEKTTQCDGMPSHDGKSIIQGNTGNGYARITLIN